jgi:hypothetical protein
MSSSNSLTLTPRSAAASSCSAKYTPVKSAWPDVGLNIETAHREARALHASNETPPQPSVRRRNADWPGCCVFQRRHGVVERRIFACSESSLIRQLGARLQTGTRSEQCQRHAEQPAPN